MRPLRSWIFVAMILMASAGHLWAATISGTVFHTDGETPITGSNLTVAVHYVYSPPNSICNSRGQLTTVAVNSSDGTFLADSLPAGEYYLRVFESSGAYTREWWAAAASAFDCGDAEPLIVAADDSLSGIDFQLEPGGHITGTVFQADGLTPLTGTSMRIMAYTGDPCGSRTYIDGFSVNTLDGSFSVGGLTPGEYFLITSVSGANFVDEWYSEPNSTNDCTGAQPVLLAEEGAAASGADFQLQPGATVSGTVYHSDGTSPITTGDISIGVYQGEICGNYSSFNFASVNTSDGTYVITGLPAGTFYLRTRVNDGGWVNEWWASEASDFDCESAQPVTVEAGESVTAKNFQLDDGGTVTGTVTDTDTDLPVEGVRVYAYAGICRQNYIDSSMTDSSGVYAIGNAPEGNVYVWAYPSSSGLNYLDTWYGNDSYIQDCEGATPVPVTASGTTTGIDFHLVKGPRILSYFTPAVQNGEVIVQLMLFPWAGDLLESAAVTLPGGAVETFDLVENARIWTSECRPLNNYWYKNLGSVQPTHYGTYTLNITLNSGQQFTFESYLPEQDLTPALESSIDVQVNADGSLDVSWSPEGTPQPDQTWSVRIRELGESPLGQEILKIGGYPSDTTSATLSASDLGCLEIGGTYKVKIRAYSAGEKLAETVEKEFTYSPSALNDRTRWVDILKLGSALAVGFDVRPASRDELVAVSLEWPAGSSYTYDFDLAADWYDMSTETRTNKGWWREDSQFPIVDGDYTFTFYYDEDGNGSVDHTESVVETFSAADVASVDPDSLREEIHSDGTISFYWDLPAGASGQKYQIRIRNLDDSLEYVASGTLTDVSSIRLYDWDLRGVPRGRNLKWWLQVYDANGSARSGTSKIFFYDPFEFGTDIPGDLNADSTVNLNDAILVLQSLSGLNPELLTGKGEVDGDGRIGPGETIYILQKTAGLR